MWRRGRKRPAMTESRPILETRGLTMRFGGVVAVDNVDFSLAEGELRCLIGPNGAGKTTFFRCLTHQYKATAGQVFYRGDDITGSHTHQIARRGIGIKTQVPSVFDGLDDMGVAGAATEIADQTVADFIIRRVRVLLQELVHVHQNARRAIAALQRVMLVEGNL